MKILRIIARLNVGGPARHVVWLTEGLKPAGFETLLVAGVVPPGEDDMSYIAAEAGVTPCVVPQMSREVSHKDAFTIWKLFRLMLRERPAIVHTHTAKAGTVGRVAGLLYRWLTLSVLFGRPRRCRFVHTYHGHVFHSYYGPLKTRLFLVIEKLLARVITDRIVVVSDVDAQRPIFRNHQRRPEGFAGRVGQVARLRQVVPTRAAVLRLREEDLAVRAMLAGRRGGYRHRHVKVVVAVNLYRREARRAEEHRRLGARRARHQAGRREHEKNDEEDD